MRNFQEYLFDLIGFVSGSASDLMKISKKFEEKKEFSRLAVISANILIEYCKMIENCKPLALELDSSFVKCQENLEFFSEEAREFCLELSGFVEKEVLDVEGIVKDFAFTTDTELSEFLWVEDESCDRDEGILRFSNLNYLDSDNFYLDSDCLQGKCREFQHFSRILNCYAKILAKCKQVIKIFTIFQVSAEKHFKVLENIVSLICQSSRTDQKHEKIEKKLQVLSNFDVKIRKSFNKIWEFSKNFLNSLEKLPKVRCFNLNISIIKIFLGERLKNVLNSFKSWTDKLEAFHKTESFSPRKLSIDSQSSSVISSRSIFNYFNLKSQIDSKIAKESLIKYLNILINAISSNFPENNQKNLEILKNLINFFSLYQDSGADFLKSIEFKTRERKILMRNFSRKYEFTIKLMKPSVDKFEKYQKTLWRTRSNQRGLIESRQEMTERPENDKILKKSRESISLMRNSQSSIVKNEKNFTHGKVLNRISSYTQNLTSRLTGKFLRSSHVKKMQKKEVYMMSFR